MRVQIKHICVPTDFSEAADAAVHYAASLAHSHGADLHLLHVLEDANTLVNHPDFSAHGELAQAYFRQLEEQEELTIEREPDAETSIDEATHRFLKSLEDPATAQLNEVKQDWWEGLEVHRRIRYGHPVEEIRNYVTQNAIDLLVVGAQGRSRLSRVLLGSVADRLARVSPCPVLLVRHPEHDFAVVE